MRTLLLTALALLAFAGNSLLCRAALATGGIDPWSFTGLRLASGALVLLPCLRGGSGPWDPRAALALWVYALGFSLAYVSLGAGTGALLLFGAVQVTMLSAGYLEGERSNAWGLLGLALALAGLVVLVAPGLSAPDPLGAALMGGAGIAWGLYSLLGRGVQQPAARTARNFLLAAPVAVLAMFAIEGPVPLNTRPALLALLSGGLTSGLGYVLWYAALGGLTATRAAIVQLIVPILAALGGVILLGEAPGSRLVVAAGLTLGGVGLAIAAGTKRRPPLPERS